MNKFDKQFLKIQKENKSFKWLHSKEEFAKKFGTAYTIIIEYCPINDIKIYDRWNVIVTYNLFGIFPLSDVIFGKNLSKQEVNELKVPFAKIYYKNCQKIVLFQIVVYYNII